MPLKTNKRQYPYPAKEESFDSSWDTFQEFFNLLDREFSSSFDFMIGTGIKYIWKTENEMLEQADMILGDYGMRMDTGNIFEYRNQGQEAEINGWLYQYDVNALPLNVDRDPTPDDWGRPIGFNWINNSSGESFYCVKNEVGKCIWISEDQAIGYEVRVGYYVQPVDFKFKGTWFQGIIEKTGKFYYTVDDTVMPLWIGAKFVGNIKLDAFKTYYGPSDLDIFEYPVDHEDYGKCNSPLFLRYLSLINKISVQASPFFFETKKLNLSATVLEIISTDATLEAELTRLGISIPTNTEKKEYQYDFFHYITYMEQVNNDRKKELLGCMTCEGLTSYDGNVALVDGAAYFIDGNLQPPCA